MAAADYRLCDVCDGKVFYDANLNYEQGRDDEWAKRKAPFRWAGEEQGKPEHDDWLLRLDYLGDWAVLCGECSKTHRTQIVPIAAPQAEPKREPLSDAPIARGDYVLATKWGDGDPGDHWGVGFYDRLHNGRHYVLDNGGKQIRGNGFRRVGRITPEMGRWLLSAAAMLESSPPGTVNLWTMLTGGSDAE